MMEIDKNQPVSVTLTAENWSDILPYVDEMPRKKGQPIWDAINEAVLKAATEAMKTNGTDERKNEELQQEGNLQAEAQSQVGTDHQEQND